jgi:hypothetical protein
MWIIEPMMMAIKDMKVIVREQAYLPYYYNRLLEAYIWLRKIQKEHIYINNFSRICLDNKEAACTCRNMTPCLKIAIH